MHLYYGSSSHFPSFLSLSNSNLIVYSIGSLVFKEGKPQVMVESIWTLSDNSDKKSKEWVKEAMPVLCKSFHETSLFFEFLLKPRTS